MPKTCTPRWGVNGVGQIFHSHSPFQLSWLFTFESSHCFAAFTQFTFLLIFANNQVTAPHHSEFRSSRLSFGGISQCRGALTSDATWVTMEYPNPSVRMLWMYMYRFLLFTYSIQIQNILCIALYILEPVGANWNCLFKYSVEATWSYMSLQSFLRNLHWLGWVFYDPWIQVLKEAPMTAFCSPSTKVTLYNFSIFHSFYFSE